MKKIVCSHINCSNTFEYRGNKKYCSRGCKQNAHGIRNRKERSLSFFKEYKDVPTGKIKYRRHKGSYCEKCGFIPEHKCQLDVDHIDGNHNNNNPENLQTLCANCHRLKTFLNKDYLKQTTNI
jgi:5-methylcytosine-specific restriction endonuclease McrA